MRVLVGGGSGFVGRHLRTLLTSKGHEMISISRKPAENSLTWDNLKTQGLPDDTGAVVNLAGENVMNFFTRYNDEFKAKLRESRISTNKLLASLITEAPQKPLVFVSASAIGYYKSSPTAEYTEDSNPGDDFMSRLCQDWEAAAQLDEDVKVRNVFVRIGLACGRDGGMIQSMVYPFYFGVGGPVGSGKQWFPWVHVDDVAGIILHAIENGDVSGVLNAVAPETATNAQFSKALAHALNRPAFFTMPGFVVNSTLGSERGAMILEGPKVIPKRTLESGYVFKYPDLKSACAEFGYLFE